MSGTDKPARPRPPALIRKNGLIAWLCLAIDALLAIAIIGYSAQEFAAASAHKFWMTIALAVLAVGLGIGVAGVASRPVYTHPHDTAPRESFWTERLYIDQWGNMSSNYISGTKPPAKWSDRRHMLGIVSAMMSFASATIMLLTAEPFGW